MQIDLGGELGSVDVIGSLSVSYIRWAVVVTFNGVREYCGYSCSRIMHIVELVCGSALCGSGFFPSDDGGPCGVCKVMGAGGTAPVRVEY